ncbi:ABC transporter permease [Rhizobium oryziradicis]|uniref:ABC transporter substrate-binding protein n=1 Tax=Rhizobium oryziradicis TaxID=1867956 RepID=A0A1Q8ZX88_9HYPH|nr:ABC transporter permease [Rhizobium oryziradicis]OLP46543.1 ABC transporter substrate-binding protein [Rhizobium oryziradicis]
MFTYTLRRLMFAVPTLLVISFIIFALLAMAPNNPLGELPLTISPEVREQMKAALGLDQPMYIQFVKWLNQFFINEPLNILQQMTGWTIGDGNRLRVLSWTTRSPVVDLIVQRMPQTLWVVGLSYLFGVMLAIPLGVISAYKQYSFFDQIGTFISMVGYSVPTFFTGVLLIVVFSSTLHWFPSVYDTSLRVTDWNSFVLQIKQMFLPVLVLTLYNTSQISRFVRASMLDNLHQDYVRTARAKGVKEKTVLLVHVLRNSMIPVITVIALGVPTIFSGAIITEQIFRVNGLGQLLITAIQSGDLPLVQTLTFIFAVLIVLFNLIADVLYGILDPRIRYD